MRMELDMKDIGRKIYKMVMELKNGKMAVNMKENINKE